MELIKRRINQYKAIFLFAVSRMFSFLSKKNYWVIFERGTDARDNGYFFYRYLKENHPEIKVYYVIKKGTPDFGKVKNDSVYFGSIKNYWIMINAAKIISSHYCSGVPDINKKIFSLFGLYKRYYFLQHGVTKARLPELFYDTAPMRLFVCGAKPEYEYIKNEFGHPQGVVQYTGLARFDNLHNITTKNQILVMPTWRKYISSEEELLKSDYFKQWQQFLLDDKLMQLLEQSGMKLVFYVHYEMQKYVHLFKKESDLVVIAKFGDYDVQTLLKESKLLLTDYSSVYFDFAYMKKPMIYFQFDLELFLKKHYQEGYFDYKRDGFGDVCVTVSAFIESIKNSFEQKFRLAEEYETRVNKFFSLYDDKNCERIYEKITGDCDE